jgi:hypothetical protein
MDQKTRDVLDAADKWLAAVEAVTAADEAPRRTEFEQAKLTRPKLILPLRLWFGATLAGRISKQPSPVLATKKHRPR